MPPGSCPTTVRGAAGSSLGEGSRLGRPTRNHLSISIFQRRGIRCWRGDGSPQGCGGWPTKARPFCCFSGGPPHCPPGPPASSPVLPCQVMGQM